MYDLNRNRSVLVMFGPIENPTSVKLFHNYEDHNLHGIYSFTKSGLFSNGKDKKGKKGCKVEPF